MVCKFGGFEGFELHKFVQKLGTRYGYHVHATYSSSFASFGDFPFFVQLLLHKMALFDTKRAKKKKKGWGCMRDFVQKMGSVLDQNQSSTLVFAKKERFFEK